MLEAEAIILDIGANHGQFSLAIAKKNPLIRVVAVEPIPKLAADLRDTAVAMGLSNHEIHAVAIGSPARMDVFHVSTEGDNGVSSLLPLSADSIATDEYWKHRQDLVLSEVIPVEVITLESLLHDLEISIVDFIKIDAQGLDLEVLLSAGDALPIIRAGMLEVPTLLRHRLYGAEKQDLRSVLNSLSEAGFDVYSIKPNDPACNEVNVFFTRPGVEPTEMENRLGLRGVSIYDGKHFWASPTSTYEGFLRAEQLIAESKHHKSENEALAAGIISEQEKAHMLRASHRELETAQAGLQVDLANSGRAAAGFREMLIAEQHLNELLTLRSQELSTIVDRLSTENEILRVAILDETRASPGVTPQQKGGLYG